VGGLGDGAAGARPPVLPHGDRGGPSVRLAAGFRDPRAGARTRSTTSTTGSTSGRGRGAAVGAGRAGRRRLGHTSPSWVLMSSTRVSVVLHRPGDGAELRVPGRRVRRPDLVKASGPDLTRWPGRASAPRTAPPCCAGVARGPCRWSWRAHRPGARGPGRTGPRIPAGPVAAVPPRARRDACRTGTGRTPRPARPGDGLLTWPAHLASPRLRTAVGSTVRAVGRRRRTTA
jgi:hypothetical protein